MHDPLYQRMAQASERARAITQQLIDDCNVIFETVPQRGIINGVVESTALVLSDVPALPQPKESQT